MTNTTAILQADTALLPRVQTPEHRAAVAAAAQRGAAEIGCRDVQIGNVEEPLLWRPRTGPVTLDGRPTEFSWVEGVRIEGCAFTNRIVVLTSVASGIPPRTDPVQVGSTIADPLLTRDVIRDAVRPFIRTAFQGCPDVRLVNTEVTRLPTSWSGPAATSPWAEHWTVAGCNQQRHLGVSFTPGERGTAFTAQELRGPLPLPIRRAL